jgi:hypothetical protein
LTQQEKYEREIQEIQEKQKREIQEIQERQKREIQERQEKQKREIQEIQERQKREIQERQERQEKQKEDAEEMLREEILIEEGMREQMQQFLQHRNIDCLKMMKCYDENVNKPTLTRHTYKTIYILYGVYTNRKVKYYDTHYSLSGFGKAHKKIIKGQSSVPRFTETNGWTECEIRNEEGEWVKLK